MTFGELKLGLPGRETWVPSTLNSQRPACPVLPVAAISKTALVREVGRINCLHKIESSIIEELLAYYKRKDKSTIIQESTAYIV